MVSELNASVIPTNSSAFFAPNDPSFCVKPPSPTTFHSVIYAILILFALVGNIAVCITCTPIRRLQTSTYYLVINLVVSASGSAMCLPFLLPEQFIGIWPMGETMCKLLKPSAALFNFVTTNTLLAIFVCHRFRAVVFPFASRPSKSVTCLIIALLWLIAFLFSLPLYGAMAVISYPDNPYTFYCIDIIADDVDKDILYRCLLYTVQVLIPVLVILALYFKIPVTPKHVPVLPLSTQALSPKPSGLHA